MEEPHGKPFTANAPMFVDFELGTPDISGDEFFDIVHPELYTPGFDDLNDLNESILSMNHFETPSGGSKESSSSDRTFIEEIDTISMTPVKIVSPKSKIDEPVVLKETTVSDIWGNVNGILASISKQQSKFGNMNSSLVVLPTNPTPRKLRISRSMHKNTMLGKPVASQPENKSNVETPHQPVKAQRANNSIIRNTRRSVVTPKVKKEAGSKIDVALTAEDEIEFVELKKGSKEQSKIKTNPSISSTKSIKQETMGYGNHVKTQISSKDESCSQKLAASERKSITKNLPEKQNFEESAVLEAISEQLKATCLSKMGLEKDQAKPSSSEHTSSIPENKARDHGEGFEHFNDFDHFEVHESRVNQLQNPMNRVKGTVLTSYARRRSSILANRRRSNKYIPMAEAMTKFQRTTPIRFRSSKPQPKQVQKVKYEPKSTIPISPALQCKTRARRPKVLSQAEREELEVQEMQKHQIHANRLRTSILTAAKPLKEVPKKPLTVPKPFHLTKVGNKPPVAIEKPSTSGLAPQKKTTLVRKNVVPTVVPAKRGISVKETEILYFGIPVRSDTKGSMKNDRPEIKKKVAPALSSSFEARNKQFLDKKEQKLKQLQSEEENKNKAEFHARPVPAITKKPPKKAVIDHANFKAQDICNTKPAPFSFEERNKILARRKEELVKKLKQEETKPRVFHANPAPTFRPVMVRGRSRENINKPEEKNVVREKSANNLRADIKIQGKSGSAENLRPKMTIPSRGKSAENLKVMGRGNSRENLKNQGKSASGQENKAPNQQPAPRATSVNMPILKPKLKTLPFELHSDKRAKLRKDYDENMRQKLEREEMKRKREQAERLAKEQIEIAEMRKNAETKARPMPAYKPLVLIKSKKPLTAPESPAWTRTKR